GVTREQLQDARQLADRKPSVESEGSDRSAETKSPTPTQSALSPGMVWRSRTLETAQSTPAADASQTDEDAQSTAEGDDSSMPSAITTPSAANLRRRSQLNRPRRGTGPVSAEDIENMEREEEQETRGMTTAPAPVTRLTVTMRGDPAPIRSTSSTTNGNQVGPFDFCSL
uniref:Uncharacterized protein n=1 Tax=Plectus sambesii TaxID=2011161 RepID=A0A914V1J6_9BILA